MKHHQKCSVYKPRNSYCDLCLSEKLCIIENTNNPNNINKRNGIGGKSMHTVKFLLDETWLCFFNDLRTL